MKSKFEPLLKREQLAKILQVTPKTIERYAIAGMPTFSKKPVRYLESECREWLKTNTRKPRKDKKA